MLAKTFNKISKGNTSKHITMHMIKIDRLNYKLDIFQRERMLFKFMLYENYQAVHARQVGSGRRRPSKATVATLSWW